jgi:hypothetical protein
LQHFPFVYIEFWGTNRTASGLSNNLVGRAIAYYYCGEDFRQWGLPNRKKGEMGKGWTIAAQFAGKIDRRRLGALSVLLLESVLVSVLLPYNYGYVHRTTTDWNVSAASKQAPADSNWLAPNPELEKTDRVLYPYSVIPGGVRNSAELQNAVAHDEVVAEHYSDFDLRAVRVARLEQAHAVFVSYRIGSRIFWTKNRLYLPAGETVVTDGEHMARTRCGNRISEAPVLPVLSNEPTPEAMEIPAAGGLLPAAESSPELPLGVPPATTLVVPQQAPGSIFLPIVPPIFPTGGTPSSPGIPTGPLPPPLVASPPPPAPTSTPEPSAAWMLIAGCACVWLLRRKARA